MRKSGIFILGALLSFAFILGNNNSVKADASEKIVYVGGQSAGFSLKTGQVQAIGFCEVITDGGVESPAARAGIRAGDYISKISGVLVSSVENLNEIVDKSKGKELSVEVDRKGENVCLKIRPVKDKVSQRYKIGVLVRDCISGIGTITYIDPQNGQFAALGHSVCNENKQEMHINGGRVYACSIVSINKGVRGKAGELHGMFLSDKVFGEAKKLCSCGIFGEIGREFETKSLKSAVASSAEVKPGNAYIYSTVNGVCPQKYEIEIVKVDKKNKENKNYVIKITDEDLISETGGIVQGMSGSPIIQEDKLVGAVTHVFLNDPTRGYGIDIETMLQAE